jgi:hypothetical protein
MAQAFTHGLVLSGSTNGLGIVVTATATAGTTIHTAIAGTTSIHEVTLYAVNNDADGEVRTLTIEFGDVVATSGWKMPVPASAGPVLVCERFPLRNGEVIAAYADEASDVQIFGSHNVVTVS